MSRFILIPVLIALTACDTAPTAAPPTAALAPIPTGVVSPADMPTAVTSEVSTAAAPTEATELASPVQKGYTTLVMEKGVAVMTDNLTQQVAAGKMEGPAAFGQYIVIGAFMKALDEAFAKDAPDPALQAAWTQARGILPKIRDIFTQLNAKKIAPAQVGEQLAPIQTEIDQMLDIAESDLGAAYRADPAQLKALRDKAIADLEKALESAPKP
jgi:hypothetical protein